MTEKLEKMRHRIEIQKFTEVENEVSSLEKGWATFIKCWASKVQLKGSINSVADEKIGTEYTYRFKIRYRNDIDESMRVVYDGVIYDIQHVNNIKETGMYETHIDCVQHKEGVYNE